MRALPLSALQNSASRFSSISMIKTAQTRRKPTTKVVDSGNRNLPGKLLYSITPTSAETAPSPGRLSVNAGVIMLDQGLYALEVGETGSVPSLFSGLQLPMIQLSMPARGRDRCVEIIDPGCHDAWLPPEGGTVIVKAPPGGGQVLVTAYGAASQPVVFPEVEIRRLDGARPNRAAPRAVEVVNEPEEVRTEIVVHVERHGDRRFPGHGWIGNRGKKLRIEAFGIRPVDTLVASDIAFKALGPNRRQTPWVTDGKLCGTRGQGLPLTGFAIRLAPHVGKRFDVVYQGAFFESGIVGPNRNGELCVPPIADDPLEAINVRLTRRPAR
jgi:hypothetical protein